MSAPGAGGGFSSTEILAALGVLVGTGLAAFLTAWKAQRAKEQRAKAELAEKEEHHGIARELFDQLQRARKEHDVARESWVRIVEEADKERARLQLEMDRARRDLDRLRMELLRLQCENEALRARVDTDDVGSGPHRKR